MSAPSVSVVRSERCLMPPEGVPLRVELAEPGERAAAFLADIFFSTAAALLILLVGGLLLLGGAQFTLPIVLFLSFLVRNAYFIFFELRWGGVTPGKRLLGLRVIDRRGGPLRAGRDIMTATGQFATGHIRWGVAMRPDPQNLSELSGTCR